MLLAKSIRSLSPVLGVLLMMGLNGCREDDPVTATSSDQVARQFVELVQTPNQALADRIIDENYVGYVPISSEPVRGKQTFVDFLGVLHRALPDLQVTLDDTFGEGDRAYVRYTAVGTHRDTLLGVPPTGRVLRISETNILRLRNGKIAEVQVSYNSLDLVRLLNGE